MHALVQAVVQHEGSAAHTQPVTSGSFEVGLVATRHGACRPQPTIAVWLHAPVSPSQLSAVQPSSSSQADGLGPGTHEPVPELQVKTRHPVGTGHSMGPSVAHWPCTHFHVPVHGFPSSQNEQSALVVHSVVSGGRSAHSHESPHSVSARPTQAAVHAASQQPLSIAHTHSVTAGSVAPGLADMKHGCCSPQPAR